MSRGERPRAFGIPPRICRAAAERSAGRALQETNGEEDPAQLNPWKPHGWQESQRQGETRATITAASSADPEVGFSGEAVSGSQKEVGEGSYSLFII